MKGTPKGILFISRPSAFPFPKAARYSLPPGFSLGRFIWGAP
jgi:hypothetical protein